MAERRDFTAIVRGRLVAWRRIAYLLCGDWARAEDLVQTALIRMYDKWHSIDVDGVDAYARTVISRLAIDESRRPWRRAEVGLAPPDRPAPQPDSDLVVDLRAALQRVPVRQRATLVLRFYGGWSVMQTAVALGVSEGTVKSQTARGLDALRAAIQNTPGQRTPAGDLDDLPGNAIEAAGVAQNVPSGSLSRLRARKV